MQKSNYVVYLDNSCVVISNLACKECFENEHKCKIRSFSKIDYVKNKDAIYVKNICKCNKNSILLSFTYFSFSTSNTTIN